MSVKKYGVSKNNIMYADADVVSRVKLFHTNRGWMSATNKTLMMGMAAGAALAGATTIGMSNANADTVSAASTSAPTTTKVATQAQPISQAVTAKAQTTTPATATASNTTATNTNSAAQAKAPVVSENAQTTQAKAPVASSQKQTTPATQAQSSQKQTTPAKNASSQKQEAPKAQAKAPVVSSAVSKAANSSSATKSSVKPAESSQASSQKQEANQSSAKQNDDKIAVTTPAVNNSAKDTDTNANSVNNSVSNNETAKAVASANSDNSVDSEVNVQKDSLIQDKTQLNNTIDAIQNSTFLTDEQKKALEQLIETGKTDSVDNLPQNFLVNLGNNKQMFVDGQDGVVAFNNFSSVTDANNTHSTQGEALKGTIVNWGNKASLPGDSKVFTNKMGITMNGQTWNAWCLQPMAKGPFYQNNDSSCDATIMQYDTQDILAKNATLIGCAWYGNGGPADITKGMSQGDANLYTHLAMSVAAWDENFDNIRDWESSHDGVTQQMVDSWRNIPQVKAILDKASTFSAATMANYQGKKWAFKAYSGHRVNDPGSQDIFSVQWASEKLHSPKASVTSNTDKEKSNGAEVKISDNVTLSYSDFDGSDITVTDSLVDNASGKTLWSGTQQVKTNNGKGNTNVSLTFNSAPIETVGSQGWHWVTNVKGSAYQQNIDFTYNSDNHDKDEEGTHPKADVSTSLSSQDTIGENISFSDTVKATQGAYNANETFNISGQLVDKNTGKVVATATAQVKGSDLNNGTAKVTFTTDTIDLQGHTLYANETVSDSKGTVAYKEDGSNDKDQQIVIPTEKIATKVENGTNGDPNKGTQKNNVGQTTIIDHVQYNDLTPGQKYTISGTLMDKATGKPMQVDGKDVTSSITFTPSQKNGIADITFTIDDSALQGHTYVAYETLSEDNKQIGVHNNLNDQAETGSINSSSIGTTATNTTANDIGGHTGNIGDDIKVTDAVSYTNLIPGQKYTMSGTLMDQATGKPVQVNGQNIAASTTFTPTSANGTVNVVFTLPNNHALQGHTVVAYETLTDMNGKVVATHNDIHAQSQSVTYNKTSVHTTAINTTKNDIGGQQMDQGQQMQITDTVAYDGLVKGQTYTLVGTLMDKATNKPVTVDGKEITTTTTFTATGQSGTTPVVFTLPDDYSLQGHSLVAFETLKQGNDTLYTHADINDKAQTVYVIVPSVHTTAINTTKNDIGGHQMDQGQQMQITDTVAYHGLVKGQLYTVNGVLMDKQTGKPVTVDGKEIDGSTTFTATGQDGTVNVIFTLPDDYSLQGHDLVAFETLNGQNGKFIADHKDINDQPQTVHVIVPNIKTTLTDTTKNDANDGNNKEVPVGENITLTDTVQYHGLVKGQTYTMNGTLMDKETGKAVQVNGKDVTASTVFTATGQDGTVDVVFTLPDNINLQGDTLVAFESLNGQNGKVITTHEDINDKGQSVTNDIVKIHTELTDNTNEQTKGSHVVPVGDGISLIDHVAYSGLQPGEQYTMTGVLMDKETGKAVQVNGKDLTETVAFIPTATSGTLSIHFLLPDDIALQGHELVAFETLKTAGDQKVVATHANWFDEDQTVKVGTPNLHTLATGENQSHNVVAGKNTVIVDQVQYHNLVPGQKYIIKGVLMDKQTGKAVMNNGKPVTAQVTFIPTTPNGTVSVTFRFDGTAYAGHQLVAFEDIYDERGRLIERHEDINDLAETVNMIKPAPKKVAQVGAPSIPTPSVPAPVAKAAEIKPVEVSPEKPAVQVGAAVAPGLPQTGDSANTEGIVALAAAGLIGLIGSAELGKKKEH